MPSNVLQIPSSPIPTHPHVKSNVSAVMRAGAGAAEHPLRSFPEGSGGAVHALLSRLPPSHRLNRPSTPPQSLPYPYPASPLRAQRRSSRRSTETIEIHGDHRGDHRGDHGEVCARVARAQATPKLCSGAGAARIAGARADAVTPDAWHAVGVSLGAHGEGLARVPAGRVHAG